MVRNNRAFSAVVISVLFCLALSAPAKTFVLTGRVRAAFTNRPIPAARVSDDSGATTLSDENGKYRLTLTRGVRYERAEAPGMHMAWTTTPSKFEALVRDFYMFAVSSPTIEGRVTSPSNGLPQPGAEVRVYGVDGFALADTLGHFTIAVPSPGTYTVSARLSQGLRQGTWYSRGVTVDVGADRHPQVDLSWIERVIIAGDPPEYDHSLWSSWRPSPRRFRTTKDRWHTDWSRFYLDADYIERAGGLEKAIGTVPGVLIR